MATRALAVALFCALAGAAGAAETQDILAFERAQLRSTCQRVEFGRDFLRRVDLDNDGIADAIVDYGHLQCDGSSTMFCGSGGCTIRFYAGLPGGRFAEAGEVLAYEARPQMQGGRTQIVIKAGGASCGRVNAAGCTQTAVLSGGRLVIRRGR